MPRKPRQASGPRASGERSVAIGGDASHSTIITGDRNSVTIQQTLQPEVVRLTRATWRPWLRAHFTPGRLVAVLVAVVVLVSSVLAIYQFVQPMVARPQAMTGTLNVAVAEFGGLDNLDREIDLKPATSLADDVFKALEQEFKRPVGGGIASSVQVWSPTQTGRIRGATAELRAAAAERRAREINADVLVYGDIATAPRGASFRAEFYLGSRKLLDAEELVGTHTFGAAIQSDGDISTNTLTREALGNQLLEKTRGLGQFVLGLDAFQASQYDRAGDYFEAAARQGPDGQGKEVLYLFQGNAAGRRNDLTAAQGYYELALRQRPDYPRATLGKAEVLFQRSGAHEDCQPDSVNLPDLLASIDAFQAIVDAPTTPGLSNVRVKANLALGRAFTCLSTAAADHWSDAQRAYSAVIAEYEGRGDTDREAIRELAAEAHAGLGLAHLPAQDEPPSDTRVTAYKSAANEYQKAIELTGHGERRAVFLMFLGHIHERLGDSTAADNDYTQAASADPAKRATYDELHRQLKERQANPS